MSKRSLSHEKSINELLVGIKHLKTYIYLKELLKLYNKACDEEDNKIRQSLKEELIYKIKGEDRWREIINSKPKRSEYLKTHEDIDEDKIIGDLQVLQTTEIIDNLNDLPKNLLNYLRRAPAQNKYSNSNSKRLKTARAKGKKERKKNKLKAIDTRKKKKKR